MISKLLLVKWVEGLKTKFSNDYGYMQNALALSRRGLGQVWPNPSVGCVIVKNGKIIGRGKTQNGGRPHAEVEAIKNACEETFGSTAYVTLEPCSHHGKTPPCITAIIKSGIKEVFVASRDPDPRVSGKGIKKLVDAGISIHEGILEKEAKEVNIGFFKRFSKGLPYVTLKTAVTVDSKIASISGSSKWITNEIARADSHMLRASYDAVLISSETANKDNPMLTCRLPGMESFSPIRILLDSKRKTSNELSIYKSAKKVPLWVFTSTSLEDPRNLEAEKLGARLFHVASDRQDYGVNLKQTFSKISKLGITRLMIEAGGHLASALITEGLVDDLIVYRAPTLIGGDGLSSVGNLGIRDLCDIIRLKLVSFRVLEDNIVEKYNITGM